SGDNRVNETMELFMPKDRLNLKLNVQLTMSVNPDKIDEIYAKIPPKESDNSSTYIIPRNIAYDTYASQVVRAEIREFLSNYRIEEIASNREAIGAELSARLIEAVSKKTPFQVRYAALADVIYPPIITEAQERAAERREAIAQEEAQLEVTRVVLERELT